MPEVQLKQKVRRLDTPGSQRNTECLTSIKKVNVVLRPSWKPVGSLCRGGVARIMYDPSWTVHVQKASEPENRELIAAPRCPRKPECQVMTRAPKPKKKPSSQAQGSGGYSDIPEVMEAIKLFDPVEIEVIED